MEEKLTLNKIKDFRKTFNKSKINKIASNAVQRNGLLNSAFDSEVARKYNPVFSLELEDFPSVTNQKSSGRCWMFASLNLLRSIIAKNLGVKDIELSEAYLMFFDKLEKCNSQLEYVLHNLNEKDDSRLLNSIMDIGGHKDGGYWPYFVNLVKKYGVCPIEVMPEVFHSSNSKDMDNIINQLITKDTSILRLGYKEGKSVEELREYKGRMLEEIYRVLAISIGQPVEKFTFEYHKNAAKPEQNEENKDVKEDKFVRLTLTPQEFYEKYCAIDLDEYVTLVSWPMRQLKQYQMYSFKMLTNVYDGKKILALNLPIEDLKAAAIATLKDNEPVVFAADVSTISDRLGGYLSTEIFDLDDLLSINLKFDKGERLLYRASSCNHMMTFTGVNILKNGLADKWKVQNSWGTDAGKKGIYIMSDEWFDEFVYEVTINKKYLTEKQLKALKGKVIELDPWSPAA